MMRLALIFFLSLVANFIAAQTVLRTGTAASSSNAVHVTVIDPHGKMQQNYSDAPIISDSVQMALKFNPTLFFRGDFPIYYEYRLSDAFSVEGALGVTYIDYIYEVTNNQARFVSSADERKNVRFLSGFSGRLQFRWYPSRYETAISGYYIAPEISRRDWQMDYYVNTGFIREPHRITRTWDEFKLQVGYQDADPYDNTFWEWYIAAGLRYADEDKVDGSGLSADFSHSNTWYGVVGGGVKLGFTL